MESWIASREDEIVAQASTLEELVKIILDVGRAWRDDDRVTIMKLDPKVR